MERDKPASVDRAEIGARGHASFPQKSAMLAGLLADRFSCRAFRPDPVDGAVIERMLAMAQMSASWCNVQPWNVIVTEGEQTERFRAALLVATSEPGDGEPDIAFPIEYSGVHRERRREVGWQLYESVGIAKGDRVGSARQSLENFRLFGAPHVLLIHSDRELGTYGAIDCGVYLGTLLLAAQSLGLGIVPQAALASRSALIRRHFDVPDRLMFVVGASFGYADDAHPANRFRSRRAPIDENARRLTI